MAESSAQDAVKAADELLQAKQKESDSSVASAKNQDKYSDLGSIKSFMSGIKNTATKISLTKNPIVNMGIDTINQAVGGMTQSLVGGVSDQINKVTAPFQSLVNDYFSVMASVTTIGVEIGMELARNAGRSIIKELDAKEKILTKLDKEVVALFNACALVANSQPFLDGYLLKLLLAYDLLLESRRQFSSVSQVLKREKRYQKREFESGLSNLQSAKDAVLPDKKAVVDIQGTGKFISDTVGRVSNKEAVAAALSIPGITNNIGKLLIEYASVTLKINLMLKGYKTALADFIDAYKRNESMDAAVISHINSGVGQLDKIIGEMRVLIFPTDAQKASPSYGATLTTSGSFWGLRLAAIEEWMKSTPVKALEALDLTGESVFRYNQSLAGINSINTVRYRGGLNRVSAGEEDGFVTLDIFSKILARANTVVARKDVSIASVRNDFEISKSHVEAMLLVNQNLKSAILYFVQTPSSATGVAKQVVGQLMGAANSLGLDRVALLMAAGPIKDLFQTNAGTATFAGNLVSSLNNVIKSARGNPDSNAQDIARVTAVRDTVERDRVTRSVEANRASKMTPERSVASSNAKIKELKDMITSVKESAKRLDSSNGLLPSLKDKTETRVGTLIPKFGDNLLKG